MEQYMLMTLIMVRSEVHRLVGFMMFMFLLEQGVCRCLQGTRFIWKAKWMICLEFDVPVIKSGNGKSPMEVLTGNSAAKSRNRFVNGGVSIARFDHQSFFLVRCCHQNSDRHGRHGPCGWYLCGIIPNLGSKLLWEWDLGLSENRVYPQW